MVENILRVGTRSSPLALKQTEIFIHHWTSIYAEKPIEIVPILTTGDKVKDRPLAEIGGKGLFAKELEKALLEKTIDCAVHSLKDLEHTFHPDLTLAAVLPRESPWDVLITQQASSLQKITSQKTVGTCSPRRQAQLHHLRPDLMVVMMRGNVETRLEKLGRGEVDALILAEAGLRRLNLTHHITEVLPLSVMIPAVGQGVIAIQTRADNQSLNYLLAALNHQKTFTEICAERTMLQIVQGNCYTPIAGYAELQGNHLQLTGMLAAEGHCHVLSITGNTPLEVGKKVGYELKRLVGK